MSIEVDLEELTKGKELMSAFEELKADIAQEKAEVKAKLDALQQKIDALTAAAQNGDQITAEQLAELRSDVQGIFTPDGNIAPL